MIGLSYIAVGSARSARRPTYAYGLASLIASTTGQVSICAYVPVVFIWWFLGSSLSGSMVGTLGGFGSHLDWVSHRLGWMSSLGRGWHGEGISRWWLDRVQDIDDHGAFHRYIHLHGKPGLDLWKRDEPCTHGSRRTPPTTTSISLGGGTVGHHGMWTCWCVVDGWIQDMSTPQTERLERMDEKMRVRQMEPTRRRNERHGTVHPRPASIPRDNGMANDPFHVGIQPQPCRRHARNEREKDTRRIRKSRVHAVQPYTHQDVVEETSTQDSTRTRIRSHHHKPRHLVPDPKRT